MDFFTVLTLTGRVLFVLAGLSHQRRCLVHVNITAHPTAICSAQQVVDAFPDDTAPHCLHRDRDRIDGDAFQRLLGRLRARDERIRSLQLRFDRGALARRRRRKHRAQLVPFLLAVPTSMDFGGVQTSTHDDDPPSGNCNRVVSEHSAETWRLACTPTA